MQKTIYAACLKTELQSLWRQNPWDLHQENIHQDWCQILLHRCAMGDQRNPELAGTRDATKETLKPHARVALLWQLQGFLCPVAQTSITVPLLFSYN